MKRCPYCGTEYPNEKVVCATDGNSLQLIGEALVPKTPSDDSDRGYAISPEERRFWDRMTFRQFAILTIRLEAVSLLFTAALEATYLPRYISRAYSATTTYSDLASASKFDLFVMSLRIIIHVAIALALIQNAERVLSWLVRDLVEKPPPGRNEKDIA